MVSLLATCFVGLLSLTLVLRFFGTRLNRTLRANLRGGYRY